MKKVLKAMKKVLIATFVFPNHEMFDEDFRQLLKIYFFLGFYQPTPSKKRFAYGMISWILIHVSLTANFAVELFDLAFKEDFKKALLTVPLLFFEIPFAIHALLFMLRQGAITDLIQELQQMHEYEDNDTIELCRTKCCKMVKYYKTYILIAVFSVSSLTICGFKVFTLVLPALYDRFAHGSVYYPLLVVNIIHISFLAATVAPCDLLHVLCMVRAGVNLKVLAAKLRQCTNSDSQLENEKNLIACVKYHSNIIEKTKQIQTLFNHYFMSKAYGVLFILTCVLYVLMKSSIKEEPLLVVIGIFSLTFGLFQFGTLCFCSQWLTQKSDDILDASYDSEWFNQSKSFRSTLRILRSVCLRPIKFGVAKIDFSHKSFYEMMSNTYYYYNNMGHTIDTIDRKS